MSPSHPNPARDSSQSSQFSACLKSTRPPSQDTTSTNAASRRGFLWEIPIWFSVFFGDPNPSAPCFDHARFSALADEQVFHSISISRICSSVGLHGTKGVKHHLVAEEEDSQKLATFSILARLAMERNDEILGFVDGPCTVCRTHPPQYLVHRPLCATRYGYVELHDDSVMRKLMSTVASYTADFTQRAEVDWSIGNYMFGRPYICSLAVPVCSGEGKCHQTAARMTQELIEGILIGNIQNKLLNGDRQRPAKLTKYPSNQTTTKSVASSDTKSRGRKSLTKALRSPTKANAPEENTIHSIGITAFVGRPNLVHTNSPTQRGQLSCIVLTSQWPQRFLPNNFKRQADQLFEYCQISGYYEQHILQTADYRCAFCVKAAKRLLHRPLLFTKTRRNGLEEEPMRRFIMKFGPFVPGRWTYPETNATLGGENDAHLFELAIPICRGQSFCEQSARILAGEFANRMLPPDVSLLFPDLGTDVDLLHAKHDAKCGPKHSPEKADLLVEKLGVECIISQPFHPDKTNANPQHSLVLPHKEATETETQEVVEAPSTEDYNETESAEDTRDEPTIVWVYVRNDANRRQYPLAQRLLAGQYEGIDLFEPLLSWDFWLLSESLAAQQVDDSSGSDYGSDYD